jgi:hypothetical protein
LVQYRYSFIPNINRQLSTPFTISLSLYPDSSEDHEINIKGLDNIVVGDYIQRKVDRADRLGSLTAADIAAIIAAKAKLGAKVAKVKAGCTLPKHRVKGVNINNLPDAKTKEVEKEQSNSEDKGRYEEVQTLGQMSTRSHKQVNRYFTAAEVVAKEVEEVEQGVEEMEEGIEGAIVSLILILRTRRMLSVMIPLMEMLIKMTKICSST